MSSTVFTLVYTILRMIYKTVLRDTLVKAIDDPNSDVDEMIVGLLDRIFDENKIKE